MDKPDTCPHCTAREGWSSPLDRRCADALADEVAVLVRRGVIDSRSPAADALLDYRSPPSSERADRIAALAVSLDAVRLRLRAMLPAMEIDALDEDAPLDDVMNAVLAAGKRGYTERDEARREVERLTRERDEALSILGPNLSGWGLVDRCKNARRGAESAASRAERAEQRLAALAVALEAAPHDDRCDTVMCGEGYLCDCWKASALKGGSDE